MPRPDACTHSTLLQQLELHPPLAPARVLQRPHRPAGLLLVRKVYERAARGVGLVLRVLRGARAQGRGWGRGQGE